MDLAGWRDLVIVIWGLIATVAIIFIAVIVFLFYRRTIALLESADLVVGKAGSILEYADKELIRPITQFGTLIQGIIQGVSMFSKIFKKKEEDEDE